MKQKKLLSFFLAAIMLVIMLPSAALAAEPTSADKFTFDKATGTITGITDKSLTEIVIPDSIDSTAVTAIGDNAFLNCGNLSSITIPSSVTSINSTAFDNCTALTSIDVDTNNTAYCSEDGVLFNKNASEILRVPSLKSGNYTIPNSVTSIGNRAFLGCTKLTSITIPNSVTSIGDGAFISCSELSSITIPSSVTSIGDGAFISCKKLTSITIPSTVTSIGDVAFNSCTNLSSITIPNSVTSIGDGAFSYCTKLSSITIPSSVTSIGDGAFDFCIGLTSIDVDTGNTAYCSKDGVLFNKNVSEIIRVPCLKSGSYTIPSTVTSIADYAFHFCTELSSITIPSTVTSIADDAFFSCKKLTSITIPSTVTSIGDRAFHFCTELSSITIPSTVTSIGYAAFYSCTKLSKVYYPGTQEQWNTIALGDLNTELDEKVIYIPVTYNKALNLIYDGNEKNLYTTENDDVTINYYDESGAMLNTAPKNSGIYTVKVSWAEKELTELEIDTFKINKATPTENPDKKTTARVLKGKTLAVASITEGEILGINNAVLDGTFAWEDETQVMDASGTASIIFTPNDTNYAPLTVNVDVTVYQTVNGGGSLSSVSSHTVRFNTDGGSSVKTQSVVSGGKATEPTEPTKDGFTFDGWYSDSELTDKYNFDTKVTTNITLYAKWTEKQIEKPIVDSSDDTNNTGDEQKPTTDKPINPFVDVKENDWFFDGVNYVNKNNLMFGVTGTTFAPSMVLTRGMLVTVLYRTEGEPEVERDTLPFADVAADSYYADAVTWAKQNGIVSGISETEFAPDENITREQIAVILYKYASFKGYDVSVGENTNILSYTDFNEISEYAIEAIQYAVGDGLMKGKTESTLNPKDNATRAEIAAILQRFIENNK